MAPAWSVRVTSRVWSLWLRDSPHTGCVLQRRRDSERRVAGVSHCGTIVHPSFGARCISSQRYARGGARSAAAARTPRGPLSRAPPVFAACLTRTSCIALVDTTTTGSIY